MKVVYVFRAIAISGGIERIIVDKSNYLAECYGYEVSILTSDQGPHPIPYVLSPMVNVEDFGLRLHLQYRYKGLQRLWMKWRLERQYIRCLHKRIVELQPDVVVTVVNDYLGMVVKAVKGVAPLIVESHTICQRLFNHWHSMNAFRNMMMHRSLSAASVIVALTEDDAADWGQHYPNVRHITNMVSLNPTGRTGQHACRRVIFVGRFDYQKRPELAIRIWQRVQPAHSEWELHIYGEGDQEAAVMAAAASAKGVVVHKPTSNIYEAYCNASFLILTSLFEPFGLVMPEAMSAGLPVVAFDSPYGPKSIISDGVDGFLVAEGDEEAFAARMDQLMTNAALCQQMGRAAMTSAQRFHPERIMPQWQKLFAEIVG